MQLYLDPEIEQFFSLLDKHSAAKTLRTIDLLEEFGYKLSMPHSKKVAEGLFELRIRGKQEIRIFFTFYKGGIYLLCGFVKKSQKIPKGRLENAMLKLKRLTQYNI